MNRTEYMRGALAFVLMIAFQAALGALFRFEIPEGNRETVTYMLGQLSGMVTMALAFYFATSKSSHDKDMVIAGMSDNSSNATGKVGDPVHVMPELDLTGEQVIK